MNNLNEPLLITQILKHVENQPDKIALKFLHNDYKTITELSYQELYFKITELAAIIQNTKDNQPILLIFEAGVEYVIAFLATLYVGRIAVTAYPPRKTRHLERLIRIIDNSAINCILTQSRIAEYCSHNNFAFPQGTQIICTDTIEPPSIIVPPKTTQHHDIAFLQYTSGSTGNPKGVMVLHGNIAANINLMGREMLGEENLSVCVSWLPIFHDMGLIGCTLLPLYFGNTVVFMAPITFLKKPFFWMQAMSEHRGSFSMAPNFSYDMVIDNLPDHEEGIDLSSVRRFVNGAEPIKASTVVNFEEQLARFGLPQNTMIPSYGMAETTLAISVNKYPTYEKSIRASTAALNRGELLKTEEHEGSTELTLCGVVPNHYTLRIVSPETGQVLEPGNVGEIWLQGNSVTGGYYQNPEKTAEIYQAYTQNTNEGPFLRTGDLGVIDEQNNLIICGRLKDVIIINGRNIYPQDVERITYESHPDLIKNGAAAFAITNKEQERIVIVAEVKKYLKTEEYAAIISTIQKAVYLEVNCVPYDIVLIPPHFINKTTSGKIQRQACKTSYLENQLRVVTKLKGNATNRPAQSPEKQTKSTQAQDLVSWIKAWMVKHCSLEVSEIESYRAFADYDLDSIKQIQLIHELEEQLHQSIDPWLLWQHPTIDALVNALTKGKTEQNQLEETSYSPIAIVGIACRFPGLVHTEQPEVDAFWSSLTSNNHAISPIPLDRWDNRLYYSEENDSEGKTYVTEGGFLKQIKTFDAPFFNISPREAEFLDPQQRLALEVVWHALEDANIVPLHLKYSNTAIYLGISTHDYDALIQKNVPLSELNTYQATGTSFSTAAGRIAYFLGTEGPCMAIDTACSSSLVSVHQAARALQEHECNLAIAGGVNLILSPETNIIFSMSHMLSPSNRCHTFDEKADGYVRGEGCGVVILKRLDDAIKDGNKIYAVIQGSAVNQDGASNGLTAPNLMAQIKVMQAALKTAKLAPEQISHVEAHGTGTPLGDPIEWEGIRQVYGEKRTSPLYVTSLKTRIGHLEAASGIAGLIKTALAIKHQMIPEHLNFQTLNSKIKAQEHMIIPVKPVAFNNENPEQQLHYAAVSSFGFSGTNAHIILGSAPQPESPSMNKEATRPQLWLLSAKSEAALQTYIEHYQQYAAELDDADFARMCWQLQTGRTDFSHRTYIVARNKQEWQEELHKQRDGVVSDEKKAVAWLFTGQGSLSNNVARSMYENSPYFAQIIDNCCHITNNHLPYSLKTVLLETPKDININETLYAQPALFVFEYALAKLWLSLGIKPSALIGHSLGEYVAIAIAEVLNLEDALSLVCARAKLMAQASNVGAMVAVYAPEETIKPLATSYSDLAIAAINGPEQTVFSGPTSAINALIAQCKQEKIAHKKLATSHAFHSSMMQILVDEFHKEASKYTYQPPQIPVVSNLTGQIAAEGSFTADYWCQHLLKTVQFQRSIDTLVEQDIGIIQEIGPIPVLSQLSITIYSFLSIPSMHNPAHGYTDFLHALGTFYQNGFTLNWHQLHEKEKYAFMPLPDYPFIGKEYWLNIKKHALAEDSWLKNLYQRAWQPISIEEKPMQAIDKVRYLLFSSAHEAPAIAEKIAPWALEINQQVLSDDPIALSTEVSRKYQTSIYYCDTPPEQLLIELNRFYQLTHWLINHDRKKPFILIFNSNSLVGHSISMALKSIHQEHPEWPIAIIEGTNTINDLFWSKAFRNKLFINQFIKIDEEHFLSEQIVPFYPSKVIPFSQTPLDNKVYLITGGAGDLGQYFIEQLLKQGVKTIIAVGRSLEPKPWSDSILALLTEAINLKYIACDLSNLTAVKDLIKSHPEITSIIHAAGELKDQTWLEQNQKDLTTVLSGKALSAWNLHVATESMPLSEFILISSLAGVFGNHGQAGYAAANAFLNALGRYRVSKGLKALVVNYGPIKNMGLFKNNEQQLTQRMNAQGVAPIDKETAFSLLQIAPYPQELICANLNLDKINMASTSGQETSVEPIVQSKRTKLSAEHIRDLAQKILKTEQGTLACNHNWFEIGMDSIMAGQLAHLINKEFSNAELTAKEIFQFAQADLLTNYLKEKIAINDEEPGVHSFLPTNQLPLSLQQLEIWNYLKLNSPAKAYYIPLQMTIQGPLSVERFKEAILNVIQIHDVFNYQFDDVLGQVSINVLDHPQIEFNYLETADEQVVSSFFNQEFDLKNGPLARTLLIKESKNNYIWLAVIHHLIADGQSAYQFMNEVLAYYQNPTTLERKKSYKEYIAWQREHYLHNQIPQLLNKWQEVLKHVPVDVPLAKDTGFPMEADVLHERIPLSEFNENQITLRKQHLTISNYFLHTLSDTLLNAFNRTQQGVVVFFSGREDGQFTEVFGDISNNVIVCLEQLHSISPLYNLKMLQDQLLQLSGNQYFRIQLLQQCNLLPQISFDYQKTEEQIIDTHELKVKQSKVWNVQSLLWGDNPRLLSFKVLHTENELRLSLKYRRDKISQEQAETLLKQWAENTKKTLQPEETIDKEEYLAQGRASILQQNLWNLLSDCPDASPYSIPILRVLDDSCEIDLLNKALEYCINKHSALRTKFFLKHQNLNYALLNHTSSCFQVIETDNLLQSIAESLATPIEIDTPPLLRGWIIKEKNQPAVLIIKIHHLIMDGISAELLLQELEDFYLQLKNNEHPILQENDNEETICLLSREEQVYAQTLISNGQYYQDISLQAASLLPAEPKPASPIGALCHEKIHPEKIKLLNSYCKKNRITANTLYLQIFSQVIAEEYNSTCVYISVVKANRLNEPKATMIGYFADNLPILISISAERFIEQAKKTQYNLLETIKKMPLPVNDKDLHDIGYLQPQFIFNYYPLVKSKGLFHSAEQILETIGKAIGHFPLWNYRQPELLNLMVRSTLEGDSLSLIYEPTQVTEQQARHIMGQILKTIDLLLKKK